MASGQGVWYFFKTEASREPAFIPILIQMSLSLQSSTRRSKFFLFLKVPGFILIPAIPVFTAFSPRDVSKCKSAIIGTGLSFTISFKLSTAFSSGIATLTISHPAS